MRTTIWLIEDSYLNKKDSDVGLQELKMRLKRAPASAPLVRKLLENQIHRLENELRATNQAGLSKKTMETDVTSGTTNSRVGGKSGIPGESARIGADVAGLTAYFGVVPVTDEARRSLNRIHEGIARAKANLLKRKRSVLADRLSTFEAKYTAAFLESSRVPQAIHIATRALAWGWSVIIFSQPSSEELFQCQLSGHRLPLVMRQLDEEMSGELSRIMPPFANLPEALKAAFGDDISICSGASNSDTEGDAAKRVFNDGQKSILYTATGAGGSSPRLHDQVGTRPRLSIFLGQPRSGPLLGQAISRTWGSGVKSDACLVFLTTDSDPDTRLTSTLIVPRLRGMGASIVGIQEFPPSQVGSHLDEKMGQPQDTSTFNAATEAVADAHSYQTRNKGNILIADWSTVEFPDANFAKNRVIRLQGPNIGRYEPKPFQAAFLNRSDFVGYSLAREDGAVLHTQAPQPSTEVNGTAPTESGTHVEVKGKLLAENAAPQVSDKVPVAERAKAGSESNGTLSEEVREYINESISKTERRAMLFLILQMTLLAFVITHISQKRWRSNGWSLENLLGILGILGLAVSAAYMLSILNPGLKNPNLGFRVLDSATEPNGPPDSADGSTMPLLIRLRQDDFYELTNRCDATSRALQRGFWVGSIAGFIALLFLVLSRT